MSNVVEVQYHYWPWSVGDGEETVNLVEGNVGLSFYGSPVLSISCSAEIFLARRYEKFLPFGPDYKTADGLYKLYESPHGILSSKESMKEFGKKCEGLGDCNITSLFIKGETSAFNVQFSTFGALESGFDLDNKDAKSPLYRSVLGWSNFFDECIDKVSLSQRKGQIPWGGVLDFIRSIAKSDDEPRMSLIVYVADAMRRHLPVVVKAARRILVRERKLLPAARVSETDTACLRWYIRQPGETTAQKAAVNRHCLQAVSRTESLDTLENKVLKDFIARCRTECHRYLANECSVTSKLNSKRGLLVKSYGNMCADLHRSPQLEDVSPPPSPIRPNYALQNDSRYRRIWNLYLRLLRQEDEEDRLWDWQSRTWADISRLLVNAGLMSLCMQDKSKGKFILQEMLQSVFELTSEQRLGSRIVAGTEPGPFLVMPKDDRGMLRAAVLEVVHSDLAGKHPVTQNFGRIGGHLYLVLSPLDGGRKTVIVLWAAHTAACAPSARPTWSEIGNSATQALKRHQWILGERASEFPNLCGFVMASDLNCEEPEIYPSNVNGAHLLQLPTAQEQWEASVEFIALILEDVLEKNI